MPVACVRMDDIGGAVSVLWTKPTRRCIWIKVVLRSAAENTECPVLSGKLSQLTSSDLDLEDQRFHSRFPEVDLDLVPARVLESCNGWKAFPFLFHLHLDLSREQIVRRTHGCLDECVAFAERRTLSIPIQDLDEKRWQGVATSVILGNEFVVLDWLLDLCCIVADCESPGGSGR